MTTSSEWNQSYRNKSFNWTISTQYTQQYYHLFQTFNMPWRRGTARILRGLPIQISRLIRTTYSVIYWHLCTIPLLQKITFVDRHVAIASRHLLLLLSLLERNLLLDVWEPPWQGATSPWPALCGREASPWQKLESWGRRLAARRAQTSSPLPLSPPWIWNEGMWGFIDVLAN